MPNMPAFTPPPFAYPKRALEALSCIDYILGNLAPDNHQNLAALTGIADPTRERERGARRFQRALTQSDLLA
jgi:hypothetical protein